MQLIDTHCHIHEASGTDDVAAKWHKAGITSPTPLVQAAQRDGVSCMITVGCTLADSELAIACAGSHKQVWASIGIHPHEAAAHTNVEAQRAFAALASKPRVVAVGECGLDFYYNHSPKAEQLRLLRFQIELALEHGLPLIFHVREAFKDFWPVFDSYKGIRGVIHSFSSDVADLEQILSRNLYVGLNGIMTFTKQAKQLDAAKAIPLKNLLLETDAPFLTPQPLRGTICEPRHVRVTAEFLAKLRAEPLETLASVSTQNAHDLFRL
ncbi:MAG TPA: TatD family hydrolase [Bacillota bacterium]|nr:TatD family hydrolase [Bacillota bacterium]